MSTVPPMVAHTNQAPVLGTNRADSVGKTKTYPSQRLLAYHAPAVKATSVAAAIAATIGIP
jgi:hypothetical protein